MLTTDDVVLGVPGRSLTYAHTAGTGAAADAARLTTAQCIIDRLPGAGTAAAFPAFGDINGCGTLPAASLKNGKFNNVLLGQTLTLSLNLRLDTDLGGVTLQSSMTSYNALNCNGPDPADLTGSTRSIPASVLGSLSYAGGSSTVASLLALANKALRGQPTPTRAATLAWLTSAARRVPSTSCSTTAACTATRRQPWPGRPPTAAT